MTKTEWILLAVIAGLIFEQIATGRRLERALTRIGSLQTALFAALDQSYKRVEQSHSMVMRVLRVAEESLGLEPLSDEEWADLITRREGDDK